MNPQRSIIFLGPTLARSEARSILNAEYRPPAGQGDIFRACAQGPVAIGLIDGVFKDAPTVRHREILWALSRGIPVFGAASMGALRAAELSDHGMIGVGLIYRWYRRFALLPDDAVAVTHSPPELGAEALSDALVDIRRSLRSAARQHLLPRAAAAAALERITALPFAERRLPPLARPAAVPQKARDARALLRRFAAHDLAANWPDVTACEPPPIVHAWLDDLQDSGLSLSDSL